MNVVSCGGVLIDAAARVLLREPSNHYGGYLWTLPKGRPDPGESPEAAARREVLEETGYNARILAPIPGRFQSHPGATVNRFFLMEPVGSPVPPGWETARVVWCTPEQAGLLLEESARSNPAGARRDRAVLLAAYRCAHAIGRIGTSPAAARDTPAV